MIICVVPLEHFTHENLVADHVIILLENRILKRIDVIETGLVTIRDIKQIIIFVCSRIPLCLLLEERDSDSALHS